MGSFSGSSSSFAPAQSVEEPAVLASSKRLQPAVFQSPATRTLVLSLLLIAVVLVAYNPVVHNGFVNYDDFGYITDNLHVREGLTWGTVKWAFTTYEQANWHPLTWLSHALVCKLFGLNAAGHHYVNVLLHSVNAILLFLLLQYATGFRWRSLMVAALFALHPINVESVAWASERKNVLSMTFFLLALYAYDWYARKPEIRRYALVAFVFALGLLAKPQVITFPFLLLLWDYWPLRRTRFLAAPDMPGRNSPRMSGRWLVLEKLPLLLISAASAVLTVKAQRAGGAIQSFAHSSLLLRLENAVVSYARYLGKAFWPTQLGALYVHPGLYPAWQVGGSLLLLLLITVWVLRAREQQYLAVGWLWFLGSLVPMIGLIQVGAQAMADRYAYLPFLGLFLILTWWAADWAQAHRLSAAWLAWPALGWLLALGMLTYRQVGYWHDTGSLWQHTLAISKDNYAAQSNLANFLLSQGRAEEAATHFRAALEVVPNGPIATLGLGDYEEHRGNLPAAIERYQTVASRAADADTRATGYDRLGFAYRRIGESKKAKQSFEAALQLAPDRAKAMTGLGLIAQGNGDLPEAIRQYSHAVAAEPSDVGYLLLAQALQRAGRLDEANTIYQSMARFSPNLAEAQKTAESFLSAR
jgi:protein O-mannosyl-transferase